MKKLHDCNIRNDFNLIHIINLKIIVNVWRRKENGKESNISLLLD